jgi:cation diffusion facilitator CzcD-associated flavoprotein CzcO
MMSINNRFPSGASNSTQVAIVGAGPYALSLAAHLSALGVDHRVFGRPLETWRERMPRGMELKSDGFASNLSSPAPSSTLGEYCASQGLPYHDTDVRVPLATFINYAMDFQKRFVPDLDQRLVARIERRSEDYLLTLEDGEALAARQVVVAVGITHFNYIPEVLAELPPELVSHSAAHADPGALKGRAVTVLGAGASAVDLAALMQESGVETQILARRGALTFFSAPTGRPPGLLQKIRRPPSGIGPGWKSRLMCDAPHLFRWLPEDLRLETVRKHLGPASAFGLKRRIEGKVPTLLGYNLKGADVADGKVRLRIQTQQGETRTVLADHVVAATGYRADLRRLPFLDPGLRERITALAHTPVLTPHFESSVAGLFFVGPIAANSFGPLMRFMFGDEYAARRLSRRLANGVP